jgi:FtsZ-binding cell division protein ZapB
VSTIDVTKLVKDVMNDTMERAFYIQAKAFFEKNHEHINEIARLKAEVEQLKERNRTIGEELFQIRFDVLQDPVLREAIKDAVLNPRKQS